MRFGISEDIAQTGDWNGDGIMDIGIHRPSTRSWYATSYATGFPLGTLGEAGEVPTASIQR